MWWSVFKILTLFLNDSKVDRVANFTYLGTILDSKMNFKLNVEHIVKKARKRIFIMKQLSFLKIAKPIRMRCYVTFIECCFMYHLSTIHGHVSKTSKKSINNVIKLAGCLGECTFNSSTLWARPPSIRSLPHSENQSCNKIKLL